MNRELNGLPSTPSDDRPESDVEGRPPSRKAGQLKLPPVKGAQRPEPSTPRFPVTTAQQIGWKSARPECQLEKYGRYTCNARGQIGILKLFNWPQQGL